MSCSCFSSHTNSMTVAEPNPAKHVNFNVGMVLGVDDFTQEFAYLSQRDRRLPELLVCGGIERLVAAHVHVARTAIGPVEVREAVAQSDDRDVRDRERQRRAERIERRQEIAGPLVVHAGFLQCG